MTEWDVATPACIVATVKSVAMNLRSHTIPPTCCDTCHMLLITNGYSQSATDDRFDGSVRAVVPLFDNEVRGVAGLRKLAEYAFAESKALVQTI